MKILSWEWLLACAELQTVLGSCLGRCWLAWGRSAGGCAAEAAARASAQEHTLAAGYLQRHHPSRRATLVCHPLVPGANEARRDGGT